MAVVQLIVPYDAALAVQTSDIARVIWQTLNEWRPDAAPTSFDLADLAVVLDTPRDDLLAAIVELERMYVVRFTLSEAAES